MRSRAGVACVALAALLALPRTVRAEDDADATYGRFDGNLGIAGAGAVTAGARGPRIGADLRLRYLSTAGLFASYEDGALIGSEAAPQRLLAVGAEVRPLFLGRWATGLELGRPRINLLIDSFALELGVFFSQPEHRGFGSRAGLSAGLGLELPFFRTASGPFVGLHAGARFSEDSLSGGPLNGPNDRALFLTVALGWQQIVGSRVVDLGDRGVASRDP